MRRRLRLRRWIIRVPLALAALAVVPAAAAGVRVQGVDGSSFPSVRLTVVAPLGAAQPSLTENGVPVAGFHATNLGSEKALVLALDRSESMRGRPLRNAIAAAELFAGSAGPNDDVGVVAFGRTAFALTRYSASPSEAAGAIAGMNVDTRAGTALYDAIVVAANRLAGDARPGRAIVVVTDGQDVSSTHTLEDAVTAARAAHASIYAIGIGGPGFTPDALRRLARETGGSYYRAASAAGLSDVYTSLQHELARTWQLRYETASRPGQTAKLVVRVPGAGAATTVFSVPGNATGAAAPTGLIPGAGYTTIGTLLLGFAVGLLVLLACLFWFAAQRPSRLRSRIEPHLGTAVKPKHAKRREARDAARTRLSNTIEETFRNVRQFRRLERMIARSDLPIRAGELCAVGAGLAFGLGLLTAVSAAPSFAILLVMAIGFGAPIGYVAFKASARVKKFENQLPDLLITLAASLKAGHSFRHGIQSVVDEGAEPAASEFKRVLTETQLGRPMDTALSDMADRVGSKNFSFVITAVTIQRQIGGSLAGLFDMVAETVRQRQQFGRKIRSLTAMGRMSAYVLVGLPFFIAVTVTLLNPPYMAPLYNTSTGHKLIVGGLLMIMFGSLLLKKIVSFRG